MRNIIYVTAIYSKILCEIELMYLIINGSNFSSSSLLIFQLIIIKITRLSK